jgi:hypothetical protein
MQSTLCLCGGMVMAKGETRTALSNCLEFADLIADRM